MCWKIRFLPSLLGALFLVLQGCYSPQMEYEWGWTTRQIRGTMLDEIENPLSPQGFIVIRSYYSQFISRGETPPAYFPQARLIFPDADGQFNFHFDLKAAKIDLTFIASGYVMQTFSFRRQVGVGDLSYQIRMQKTKGWQDHLFVTITPFLQQFILEQRYQLAQAHQLFLGEWLTQEKEKHSPGA